MNDRLMDYRILSHCVIYGSEIVQCFNNLDRVRVWNKPIVGARIESTILILWADVETTAPTRFDDNT